MDTENLSAAPDAVPHRLLRCLLRLGRRLRNTGQKTSLPPASLQVLGMLHQRGHANATRLAEELGIKKQSLTLLLAALHHNGLIRRERDEGDTRRVSLFLTDAGRDLFLRELHGRQELLSRLIREELSAEDASSLPALLPILEKLAFGNAPPAPRGGEEDTP